MNNLSGMYFLKKIQKQNILGIVHLGKHWPISAEKIAQKEDCIWFLHLGVTKLSVDFSSFFDRSGLKMEMFSASKSGMPDDEHS